MLGYLKSWELNVQEREGYKECKYAQQKMLLSHETRMGCKLSGMTKAIQVKLIITCYMYMFTAKSFVELVKYLFLALLYL